MLEHVALFDRAGWPYLGEVGLLDRLAKLGTTRLRLGMGLLWSELFVEAQYGHGYFLGTCQPWKRPTASVYELRVRTYPRTSKIHSRRNAGLAKAKSLAM